MDEKHLVETAGIDIDDWEQTPVSVRKVVVQLAGKVEQLEQLLKELQVENQQLREKSDGYAAASGAPLRELPQSTDFRPPRAPEAKEKEANGKKAWRATGPSRS